MHPQPHPLSARLIRNFNEVPLENQVREPLYASMAARLAPGTAAQKPGAAIDTVAPGKRSCPYHFHHAQEEMFIVLEGTGTLRVRLFSEMGYFMRAALLTDQAR